MLKMQITYVLLPVYVKEPMNLSGLKKKEVMALILEKCFFINK